MFEVITDGEALVEIMRLALWPSANKVLWKGRQQLNRLTH
jgi:hypothetical protein